MNNQELMDYLFARAESQLALIDSIVDKCINPNITTDCELILESIEKDIQLSSKFIPERDDINRIKRMMNVVREKIKRIDRNDYEYQISISRKFRNI